MSAPKSNTDNNITLYTTASPNGFKVSITLEELNLPYTVVSMDIMHRKDQQEKWFLDINPNGKIPAIKDGELCIWESGAVLLYLAERYDTEGRISFRLNRKGSGESVGEKKEVEEEIKRYWEMVSWVMWHVSEQMSAQAAALHFHCFTPVRADHSREKSLEDCKRAYNTLEHHLSTPPTTSSASPSTTKTYLVGEKYTIADIAIFSWTQHMLNIGVELTPWPNVLAWKERIEAREAVRKGLSVPEIGFTKEQIKEWFKGLREKVQGLKREGEKEEGKEEVGLN